MTFQFHSLTKAGYTWRMEPSSGRLAAGPWQTSVPSKVRPVRQRSGRALYSAGIH